MFEFTALIVIILVYIIPLNLYIYSLANKTAIGILTSQNDFISSIAKTPPFYGSKEGAINTISVIFYIVFILMIFIVIYLLLKFILLKLLYVYLNSEIEVNTFLLKYSKGQRNINSIANGSIVLILVMHLFLGIFDIKIFVFGILCILYIFKQKIIKTPNIKKIKSNGKYKNTTLATTRGHKL
jgi:hypothetical protein